MAIDSKNLVAELQQRVAWTEGFQLFLIFADPEEDVDSLYQDLTQKLGPGLRLPTTPIETLHGYALSIAEEGFVQGESCFIWLALNTTAVSWAKARENFLTHLNERRDRLRRNLNLPLILLLPSQFQREIAQIAPDLWYIRGATFYAESEKQEVKKGPHITKKERLGLVRGDMPSALKVPEALLGYLEQGQLLLLVGPECAHGAGLLTPVLLLEEMQRVYGKGGLLADKNKGMLETWMGRRQDDDRVAKLFHDQDPNLFFDMLADAYDPDPTKELKIITPPHWYSLLDKLGLDMIVTTGYDLLLNEALPEYQSVSWTDEMPQQGPWICHYLGRADRRGTVVLTLDQIRRHEERREAVDAWLRQGCAKRAVLAVGFTPEDQRPEALRDRFQQDMPWFRLVPKETSLPSAWQAVHLHSRNTQSPRKRAAAVRDWFLRLGRTYAKQPTSSENSQHTFLDWLTVDQAYLDGLPKTVSPENLRDFYRGEAPTWTLVHRGYTAHRKTTDRVLKELRLDEEINCALVLVSAGGEGKSTVLKQIGVQLALKGYVVYEAQFGTVDLIAQLHRIHNRKGAIALIVDNAKNQNELMKLTSLVEQRPFPTRLILAARENEWNDLDVRKDQRKWDTYVRVRMASLDLKEAQDLGALLKRAGSYTGKLDEAVLASQIYEESRKFLLPTLLLATQSELRKDALTDVVAQLQNAEYGPLWLRGLGLVVALERMCRQRNTPPFACHHSLFLRALGLSRQGSWQIKHRLGAVVNLRYNGNFIMTRHSLIADTLYAILFQAPSQSLDLMEIYRDALRAAGTLSRENDSCQERTWLTLIPLYLADQENDKARTLFRISTDADPSQTVTWLTWAIREKKWNNSGNLQTPHSARWLFQRAVDTDPNNALCWQEWAVLERDVGNLGDLQTRHSARWLFQHSVDVDPNNVLCWQAWAILERDAGNLGDLQTCHSARWLFQRAIDVDPKHTQILQAWAILERDAGNLGDLQTPHSARWLFLLAVNADPNDAKNWYHWAILERDADNLGDLQTPQSARRLFKRAVDADPNDAPCWLAWARLEEEAGHLGDVETPYSARWLFARALSIDSYDAFIWHRWAKMEWQEDQLAEAERLLAEGLSLCPQNIHLRTLELRMAQHSVQHQSLKNKQPLTASATTMGSHTSPRAPTPAKPTPALPITADPPDHTKRDQVFICYSRKDNTWKKDLLKQMKPLHNQHDIKPWHDGNIQPGTLWREEISKVLAQTRVALILVSVDFLDSDFIAEQELPHLLQDAQDGHLTILWVLLRSCVWEETALAQYQSVFPDHRPLAALGTHEREAALAHIARTVKNAYLGEPMSHPEDDA